MALIKSKLTIKKKQNDLKSALVKELSKLISIDSQNPPGNEAVIISYIKKEFNKVGIKTKVIGENKRHNLIAEIKLGTGKRKILFMPHIDTVLGSNSWNTPPLKPVLKGNKLYGLGSGDMKCAAASHIVMARELMKNKKVHDNLNATVRFAFCADEEVTAIGINYLLKKVPKFFKCDLIICGEPTNLKLKVAHKGICPTKIDVFGKSAHGSTPQLGVNAINAAAKIITGLKNIKIGKPQKYFETGVTLNVGIINGGDMMNKVADHCSFVIDVRLIPNITPQQVNTGFKKVIDKLRKVDKNSWNYKITNLTYQKAVRTSDASIKKLEKIFNQKADSINYTTDLRFLKADFVVYGAGNEKLAHCPNECVEINKLVKSHKDYFKLLEHY
ncbi:ArgE/DapE family deacylase [Candidatus Woesearchaeota archaeon]|nr:ArgE/DapE family deacylase [Candidatus Woesearchaeota archaeon]